MNKAITIADIMRQAGVLPSTVSRVLPFKAGKAEAKRALVRAANEQLLPESPADDPHSGATASPWPKRALTAFSQTNQARRPAVPPKPIGGHQQQTREQYQGGRAATPCGPPPPSQQHPAPSADARFGSRVGFWFA